MKMYLSDSGVYFATQDEAKKHAKEFGTTFDGVDVPVKLRELVAYLNTNMVPAPGSVALVAAPEGHAAAPGGNGTRQQADPNYTQRSVDIDEVWGKLPFSRKFHFAALAMEEARDLVPLAEQVAAKKPSKISTAEDLL